GRRLSRGGDGDLRVRYGTSSSEDQSDRTAVSFIDTRTFGSSTPSFPTARAGGSVGKNFAYASLRPPKSLGLASRTWTSTIFSSFAPPARRIFSQFTRAWRVCSSIAA